MSTDILANRFHLAIPVFSIEKSLEFYCDFLGCSAGNFEEGKWQDINFWGNELTLHEAEEVLPIQSHAVDMGNVSVPHFGVHLTRDAFDLIKKKIEESEEYTYHQDPYLRFKDDDREQETFFIADPSGNIIELKTMYTPKSLWIVDL